nr:arginase family protein [Pseudobdellovibrionaceae bacterium]
RNIPICVGGDHSYTYPLVKALYRKDPELIFMYLDSHLDLQVWNQDPLHGESQICHSNFVSHLIRDLPFLKVGQLGAKRFLPIEKNQEINFLNQINKFEVLLDSESCENRPLAEIQKELPRGRRMYLSIDLDVLGSPYLQQTGHPNPSGISPMRLLSLLETLVKENHIVGLDFMEFGKSGARDVHRNEAVLVTELMLKIMQLLIGKFNE